MRLGSKGAAFDSVGVNLTGGNRCEFLHTSRLWVSRTAVQTFHHIDSSWTPGCILFCRVSVNGVFLPMESSADLQEW